MIAESLPFSLCIVFRFLAKCDYIIKPSFKLINFRQRTNSEIKPLRMFEFRKSALSVTLQRNCLVLNCYVRIRPFWKYFQNYERKGDSRTNISYMNAKSIRNVSDRFCIHITTVSSTVSLSLIFLELLALEIIIFYHTYRSLTEKPLSFDVFYYPHYMMYKYPMKD